MVTTECLMLRALCGCLCGSCKSVAVKIRLYFRLLCASAKLSRPDQGLKRFFSVLEGLPHFCSSNGLRSENVAIVAVKLPKRLRVQINMNMTKAGLTQIAAILTLLHETWTSAKVYKQPKILKHTETCQKMLRSIAGAQAADVLQTCVVRVCVSYTLHKLAPRMPEEYIHLRLLWLRGWWSWLSRTWITVGGKRESK